MAGWTIEVTGIRNLLNILNEVDKKAADEIRKAMREAGKKVAENARGRIDDLPLRNWGPWDYKGRDLGFYTAEVQSGFSVTSGTFRTKGVSRGYGVDVVQRDAAGAVYEVIGNASKVQDKRGAQFVDSINAKRGRRNPRTLFPAYYAVMGDGQIAQDIADKITNGAREAGLG